MIDAALLLLGISFILFFGFFAEFLFIKKGIPDILFLILLGILLGPYGLKYVNPSQLQEFAPVFTTFTLLFLIYDGAFNIDLTSFVKGFSKGFSITLFNFVLSVSVVTAIMYLFGFEILQSILTGCILGGISSAFVIPLIKELKIKGETYFILTLESALTDVLCIVSALAILELLKLQTFSAQVMVSKLASLFAVAGFIGIVAGILWIILVTKIFREHKSYMITIAYVILVFIVTEFMNGNGAIAALFLGLVLRNSKQLSLIFTSIANEKEGEEKPKIPLEDTGISVTSNEEQFFYSQISFFLKTFFFVYVGVIINLEDMRALLIGLLIAVSVMSSRKLSWFLTKNLERFDRSFISAIFARGLAAAAIAQIVIMNNVTNAAVIENITYSTICFTIIFSSIMVFLVKKVRDRKIEIDSSPSPSS